jgi:hypothetical protein
MQVSGRRSGCIKSQVYEKIQRSVGGNANHGGIHGGIAHEIFKTN